MRQVIVFLSFLFIGTTSFSAWKEGQYVSYEAIQINNGIVVDSTKVKITVLEVNKEREYYLVRQQTVTRGREPVYQDANIPFNEVDSSESMIKELLRDCEGKGGKLFEMTLVSRQKVMTCRAVEDQSEIRHKEVAIGQVPFGLVLDREHITEPGNEIIRKNELVGFSE